MQKPQHIEGLESFLGESNYAEYLKLVEVGKISVNDDKGYAQFSLNINNIPSKDQISYKETLISNWRYLTTRQRPAKEQPLLKALGKNLSKSLIIDLTCGSAKDSLLLLSYGLNVISLERNSLQYLFLLLQRFNLFNYYPKLEQWQLLNMDAMEILPMGSSKFSSETSLKLNEYENIILYYDPMYITKSHERKSLPRKELVALEAIVGKDEDKLNVFKALLGSGSRLVVKHSSKDKTFINAQEPRLQFGEKSTIYSRYNF